MRPVSLALILGFAALPLTRGFAQEPPVVVELFTSEACSSCPPADAFLTDLARQRHDVLPLAFHVTYWNNIGWTDSFSLGAATRRQQAYARSLGDNQVYTPEMVVNGTRGFVGSSRNEGLQAISQAVHDPAPHIPLELTREGSALAVKVAAGPRQGPMQGPVQGPMQAEVLLVGFDTEHQTPIGRGENTGRTLLESNIVRSLTPIGNWTGAALSLHQAAPSGQEFAVLLQAPDGRILGAARLSDPAS